MKVCMFVKNSFEYDARVTKEARTLIDAGHSVTVVAYLVPGVTPRHELRPDGIEVYRISRVNLGVDALNRLAESHVTGVEERHARLTGDEVDVSRIKEGRLSPRSTVTPTEPAPSARPAPTPAASHSTGAMLWARASTPLLRSVTVVAKLGFRLVKAVLGRQGLALKTLAINRRMIGVGIAQEADVYHCHDLNTLYIGHRCKQATGAKLVYDSHELQTERSRMGFWWKKWAKWNEKRWLPSTDALIVASPPWIHHIRRLHGSIPALAVPVINVPEKTVIEVRDLRPELGLMPGTPLLLYQGSIQENRGIEPAIDAVELLDDVVLVIVGYGYYRDKLEANVARRGLADRVRFFGPIPNDQLLHWTASADVGLCNIVNASLSYYTTLPNKLFEYMMAEVPVLGSDSPGIGRVVAETGVGEVVDPLSPSELAAATRKILDDPEPYRAACRVASERYNWEVESAHLTHLYRRLEESTSRR